MFLLVYVFIKFFSSQSIVKAKCPCFLLVWKRVKNNWPASSHTDTVHPIVCCAMNIKNLVSLHADKCRRTAYEKSLGQQTNKLHWLKAMLWLSASSHRQKANTQNAQKHACAWKGKRLFPQTTLFCRPSDNACSTLCYLYTVCKVHPHTV